MTTSITEYTNVRKRLHEMGCNDPLGFTLLPNNFESVSSIADFRQAGEAATVKTLLRSAKLPHTDILPPEERPPYIHNNSFDWLAPTLFVSFGIVSQNPHLISLALSVIANYLTDFFCGLGGEKKIKLDIVVEKNNSHHCKKISYEGSVEGLVELSDITKALIDE